MMSLLNYGSRPQRLKDSVNAELELKLFMFCWLIYWLAGLDFRLFDDTTRKGSVIIQGLQEVMVHTQSQVLEELRKGSAKRQAAATLMNAHSR